MNLYYCASDFENIEDFYVSQLRLISDDEALRDRAMEDLIQMLTAIGIHDCEAFSAQVLAVILKVDASLNERKSEAFKLFRNTEFYGKSVETILSDSVVGRSEQIFCSNILPFLSSGMVENPNLRVCDLGCGDGAITRKISNLGIETVGYDVQSYPVGADEAQLVKTFNGLVVPESDRSYEVVVVANVFHHADSHKNLFSESARILKPGGMMIVVETVPLDDSRVEWFGTFFGDLLYNQFIPQNGIELKDQKNTPVPGNYELAESWVEMGECLGLVVEYQKFLGVDIPAVPEAHHQFVFRKGGITPSDSP